MRDKRNELIKEARMRTAGHDLSEFYSAVAFSGYKNDAIDKLNEVIADFALESIAKERRAIADKMTAIQAGSHTDAAFRRAFNKLAKELRAKGGE